MASNVIQLTNGELKTAIAASHGVITCSWMSAIYRPLSGPDRAVNARCESVGIR